MKCADILQKLEIRERRMLRIWAVQVRDTLSAFLHRTRICPVQIYTSWLKKAFVCLSIMHNKASPSIPLWGDAYSVQRYSSAASTVYFAYYPVPSGKHDIGYVMDIFMGHVSEKIFHSKDFKFVDFVELWDKSTVTWEWLGRFSFNFTHI